MSVNVNVVVAVAVVTLFLVFPVSIFHQICEQQERRWRIQPSTLKKLKY